MSKPELSSGVVFDGEEPRSEVIVQAGRAVNRFGGLLSHVPGINIETVPEKTAYQLERQMNNDAITMSNAFRERADEDALESGVVVETVGYPYDVIAEAQTIDDPSLKVTAATLDIVSEAGNTTQLQIRTAEVPPEYNHAELIEPTASVRVVEGAESFGIDDYAPAEQKQLAEVVRRATTAIDRAKVLRVDTGEEQKLLMI